MDMALAPKVVFAKSLLQTMKRSRIDILLLASLLAGCQLGPREIEVPPGAYEVNVERGYFFERKISFSMNVQKDEAATLSLIENSIVRSGFVSCPATFGEHWSVVPSGGRVIAKTYYLPKGYQFLTLAGRWASDSNRQDFSIAVQKFTDSDKSRRTISEFCGDIGP